MWNWFKKSPEKQNENDLEASYNHIRTLVTKLKHNLGELNKENEISILESYLDEVGEYFNKRKEIRQKIEHNFQEVKKIEADYIHITDKLAALKIVIKKELSRINNVLDEYYNDTISGP